MQNNFSALLKAALLAGPGIAITDGATGGVELAANGSGGVAVLGLNQFTFDGLQINNSGATPLILVPAPGIGKIIIPILTVMKVKPGSIGWSSSLTGNVDWLNDFPFLTMGQFDYQLGAYQGINWSVNQNVIFGLNTPTVLPLVLPGNFENQALILGSQNDESDSGAVDNVTLATAGVGYAIGDTGYLADGASDQNATYQVLTVDVGTGVATFLITAPGTGYNVFDNPINCVNGGAQPGTGHGFQVNVNSILLPNGTVDFSVLYLTLSV